MTPYQQLYSVVDGAVLDAFKMHPDYLTPKGRASARKSVCKRVTGTVLGFAVQYAAQGRAIHPASSPDGVSSSHQAGEGNAMSSPDPHCRIGRVFIKKAKSSRHLLAFNETTNMLRRASLKAKEVGAK